MSENTKPADVASETTDEVETAQVEVVPFESESESRNLMNIEPAANWTTKQLTDFALKALRRTDQLFAEGVLLFWKSGQSLTLIKEAKLHQRNEEGWTKWLKKHGFNHTKANAAVDLYSKFKPHQLEGLTLTEAIALASPRRGKSEDKTGKDSAAAESKPVEPSNNPPADPAPPTATTTQAVEPAQVVEEQPQEPAQEQGQEPDTIAEPVVRTPAKVVESTRDRLPFSTALTKWFEKDGLKPQSLESVTRALWLLEDELIEAGMTKETAETTVQKLFA